MKGGSYLSPSLLPSASNISFPETSFFTSGHKCLPSAAEVRHAAELRSQMGNPIPVSFSSMDLIVKYGRRITIAEGQCLWAIRRLCPNVPVPEIYGWCQDGGETFLYMQKIQGTTLEEAWPNLDVEEKYEVCTQLRSIIDELRQLQQDPVDPFIGSINRQPVQDIIFEGSNSNICFPDVKSFHNWFSRREMPQPESVESDLFRSGLLDGSPIVFTHNDLHRSNIMLSWHHGKPRIAGIVDWHQSGWYPAPWEFYKTRYTCRNGEQWELDFILEILQAYRGYISWDYFVLSRGT